MRYLVFLGTLLVAQTRLSPDQVNVRYDGPNMQTAQGAPGTMHVGVAPSIVVMSQAGPGPGPGSCDASRGLPVLLVAGDGLYFCVLGPGGLGTRWVKVTYATAW